MPCQAVPDRPVTRLNLPSPTAQRQAAIPDPPAPGAAARPRRIATRRPLPDHLPHEPVVHEPEIACRCGNCGPARLARLGENVTEVLEKVSAQLK